MVVAAVPCSCADPARGTPPSPKRSGGDRAPCAPGDRRRRRRRLRRAGLLPSATKKRFLAFWVNLLSLLLLPPLIKINKYERPPATGHGAARPAAGG